MQQSPKLIVGFDCDQSALASSVKQSQGSAARSQSLRKGLLKGLLSGHGSCCLYSDDTHYSDEYETDDEFFVEGSEDSEEHQSSDMVACSSSPASGLSQSSPIDIPYKRSCAYWPKASGVAVPKPLAVYTATQLRAQRSQGCYVTPAPLPSHVQERRSQGNPCQQQH